MPNRFTSILKESLSASTACLEAKYHPARELLKRPAIEEILMILPEYCFFIYGRTNLVKAAKPNTFTSNCRLASAMVTFSIAPKEP